MAINSKNKGNTFERKIAQVLSERFMVKTGIKTAFRRNVDSGSFFGATNQKRLESHGTENACFGDLLAPATFNFSIECKHYKDAPSFSSILKQDCKQFDKWIGQAEQDATNSGKLALIIIKFNNVMEFVMVREDRADALMRYKAYAIVPLETWLKGPDSYFFAV